MTSPSDWNPIETAPRKRGEAPHVLLAYFVGDELRTLDYGVWEWIENSDWDNAPVWDWSTVNGSDCEWTHWLSTEALKKEEI